MVSKGNLIRFGNAFERLIVKMSEVDDFCVEMTQDITKQDLSLIGYIGMEGEVIMRQIAEFLDVPLSTATWIVDKLVAKNYLDRFPSENDRRIVKVKLTRKGIGVYDLFQSKKMEMGTRVLKYLEKEEQEYFIQILEKIGVGLKNHQEQPA